MEYKSELIRLQKLSGNLKKKNENSNKTKNIDLRFAMQDLICTVH